MSSGKHPPRAPPPASSAPPGHGKPPAKVPAPRSDQGYLPPLARLPSDLQGRVGEYLQGCPSAFGALACAHRALAHWLALVTRLENVDEARLLTLVDEVTKTMEASAAAAAAASTAATRPLPTAELRRLHFASEFNWEEDDQALLESFASLLARPGAFPVLEELDLSETRMGKYELGRVLQGLVATPISSLHLPFLVDPPAGEEGWEVLTEGLVELKRLTEIHQTTGGAASAVALTMKAAGADSDFAARLEVLDVAKAWGETVLGSFGRRTDPGAGFLDSGLLLKELRLLRGLRVLRLEIDQKSQFTLMQSFWYNFKSLEELVVRFRKPDRMFASFAMIPKHVERLEVLRSHGLCGDYLQAVGFCNLLSRDGHWDALRVLDLTDCLVADIGLCRLAEKIAAGFGSALEELDFTLNRSVRRSQQTTIGPEGLRALGDALRGRQGQVRLRRLKLGGQYVTDGGVREIVDAWAAGGAFDELEELNLKECGLTDEALVTMLEEGFIGPGKEGRRSRLQRLVLERNHLRGEGGLARFVEAAAAAATAAGGGAAAGATAAPRPGPLARLNLARNYNLTRAGIVNIVSLLGAGLRELKLGSEGTPEEADAAVRAALLEAGPLPELRRLDIRRAGSLSRAMVGEVAAALAAGVALPRLCELELTVADARSPREAAAVEGLLKASRRPRVFDVLEINRSGAS